MPAVIPYPEGRAMTGETFAAKLKRLREAAGLTQPALAGRAGMNQYGIAKLEQGVREPSWATVQTLARALEVSTEELRTDAGQCPARAPTPKKAKRKK
jgi:transcriptional regulator with XRE-family HTH domain